MAICFICGSNKLRNALCSVHAQLANVWAAVAGGLLSDWYSRGVKNHKELMTSEVHRTKANWQVDLAVILATHGIILDDGAGYGE